MPPTPVPRRQGGDGSTVDDRAAGGRKAVRLGRQVAFEDELAVADLHDPGPDVGHHPGGRPFLVELRQSSDAVRLVLPIYGEVGRRAGGAAHALIDRCSSITGAISR